MASEDKDEGLPMEGEPEIEQEPDVEIVEEVEQKKEDKPPEEEVPEVEVEEEISAKKPEEEKPEEEEEVEEEHKPSSKERRERRKQKERRIREERDFLLEQNRQILARLAQVEGVTIETRMVTVDAQLQECLNDAATAENLEFDARQQNDLEAERQARRLRDAARDRANIFKAEKERLASALTQRQQIQQAAPPPGAAEIQRLSARFRADKPWLQFAANGSPTNDETAVALSIDRALKKEGKFSEYEGDYWDELDRRTKAALPHLFGEADESDEDDDMADEKPVKKPVVVKKEGPKGPAVGSSGNQANSGTVRRRISPDRVAALKEIGVWDDPKERAEYLKAYDDYDKTHGARR